MQRNGHSLIPELISEFLLNRKSWGMACRAEQKRGIRKKWRGRSLLLLPSSLEAALLWNFCHTDSGATPVALKKRPCECVEEEGWAHHPSPKWCHWHNDPYRALEVFFFTVSSAGCVPPILIQKKPAGPGIKSRVISQSLSLSFFALSIIFTGCCFFFLIGAHFLKPGLEFEDQIVSTEV